MRWGDGCRGGLLMGRQVYLCTEGEGHEPHGDDRPPEVRGAERGDFRAQVGA